MAQVDPLQLVRTALAEAAASGQGLSVSDTLRAAELLHKLQPPPSAGDIAFSDLMALGPQAVRKEIELMDEVVRNIRAGHAEHEAMLAAAASDPERFEQAVQAEVKRRMLAMRRKRRRKGTISPERVLEPPEPRRELPAPEPVAQPREEAPEPLALMPGPISVDRPRRTGLRAPINPRRRRRLGRFP